MPVSLYRKYRPQRFEDVVGQTPIEQTLRNALAEGRVSHAYLFCGPRGTGKTTTARLLAKALLCEHGPTADPCAVCESCHQVADGTHPDVYELDAASRTGVENVREEIIGRVGFAPTRGRYKIYIIDEVHMLSTAAFNALLKTLEEPPGHVIFVLCTTDPHKVPETILSRCQRFDFRRIPVPDIVENLRYICDKEGFAYEEASLELVARHSDGGMRDAITYLEQLGVFTSGNITFVDAEGLLGEVGSSQLFDVADMIAKRDVAGCFRWVAGLAERGTDYAQLVGELTAHVRNLYVALLTGGREGIIDATPEEMARYHAQAQGFGGPDRLARLLGLLGDLADTLKSATDSRLAVEVAFTRMARPVSDLTLESLAERVEELERGAASQDARFVAQLHAGIPQQAMPPTASGVPAVGGAAEASDEAGMPDRVGVEQLAPSNQLVGAGQPEASVGVEAPTDPEQPAAFEASMVPAAPGLPDEPAISEVPPVHEPSAAGAQLAVSEREVLPEAEAAVGSDAQPPTSATSAGEPSVSAGAASAVRLNSSALQRVWMQVMDAVKAQRGQLYGSLAAAKVEAADDGSLIVVLPEGARFAKNIVEEGPNATFLRGKVEQAVGHKVDIRVTLSGQPSPAATGRRATGEPAPRRRSQQTSKPWSQPAPDSEPTARPTSEVAPAWQQAQAPPAPIPHDYPAYESADSFAGDAYGEVDEDDLPPLSGVPLTDTPETQPTPVSMPDSVPVTEPSSPLSPSSASASIPAAVPSPQPQAQPAMQVLDDEIQQLQHMLFESFGEGVTFEEVFEGAPEEAPSASEG